jgi:2-polyprenyl-3-methyl-5-hydroxy-6-metoxy-1,4-benzoquinol methylase
MSMMNAAVERILIQEPYPALRVNDHVFRETTYGIVKRLRFFLNHIESERQRRNLEMEKTLVLDVGCGTGINVTIPLAIAGYSVIGLDIDQASIERARQTARGMSNAEFRCSALSEMQFSEPFQVVICSEVLEHLERPALLIQQIQDVMESNGLLLMTVPNGYGYFEAESFVERCFPQISRMTDRFQHRLVKRYGRDELKQRHADEWRPEYYQLAWTTLAPNESHFQRFTPSRIRQLLTAQNFEIIEFSNRTFLAGNILNSIVRDWDAFLKWNCNVADLLPYWMCVDWMIAAHRFKNK